MDLLQFSPAQYRNPFILDDCLPHNFASIASAGINVACMWSEQNIRVSDKHPACLTSSNWSFPPITDMQPVFVVLLIINIPNLYSV